MDLLEILGSLGALGVFFWFLLRVLHGPADRWAEKDLEWMSTGWCVEHLPGMRWRR